MAFGISMTEAILAFCSSSSGTVARAAWHVQRMGGARAAYGCGTCSVWVWHVQRMRVARAAYGCGTCSVCVWHVQRMGVVFGIAMTESTSSLLHLSSSSLNPCDCDCTVSVASHLDRATGYAKWVHLAWQAIALILMAVGMAAIIASKGTKHKHMYSVHTYCGVLTLALFAVQFMWGLCAFVLFKSHLSEATRYQMGTYHILLGKFTYYAGIGTCVNGFSVMQVMMVDAGQPHYGSVSMAQSWASLFLWFTCAAVFGAMTTCRTAELVTDSDEKEDAKNIAV
ncbi:unnamed protein product [Closterium sp. Yama58-4]|nr:unnamed protein product [Closterium sp. Yama58-4]